MRKTFIIAFGIAVIMTGGVFWFENRIEVSSEIGSPWIGSLFANENESVSSQKIEKGVVFASVAESLGLTTIEASSMLENSKNRYDLSKIVEGREISAISDKETSEIKKLVYQIDSEEALLLERAQEDIWIPTRITIPYAVEAIEINGTINSSLFETITESGGDERVALALAEVFAWQIDFAVDIRAGDEFKLIYEKKSINGNYIGPGNILAAKFINDGKNFNGVYFASSDGEDGHYDLEGNSLQKIFLKSPLSYKYISSGFSYNRLNPVSRTLHAHRAIDYAAPHGTPVVSVGGGTASYAGYKGTYGNMIEVRHNDTYKTVYAHLSRFAVRSGSKVEQGQIIGYVGATGQATGPHLHFEMHKNGGYVNPLTIELPPGEAIKDADRSVFGATVTKYEGFLES